MSVADHPVHETVKIKSDKPYSCSISVRSEGYWAPNRMYRINGTHTNVNVFVTDISSKLCRYDMRANDPRCQSCKKESDNSYLRYSLNIA